MLTGADDSLELSTARLVSLRSCHGTQPVDQHSPQRLGSPSHLHTSYPHARSTCKSRPEMGGTDEATLRRVFRYQLCSQTITVGLHAVACDRTASETVTIDTVTIDTAVSPYVDRTGSSGPGHVARGGIA